MAMGGGGGTDKAVSDINVTPLIDVLLVLLIIFMVIVPIAPHGLNTLIPQPPKDKSNPPPDNDRTIVVQVLGDGSGGHVSYKINDDDFAKTALEAKLAEIFSTRSEKVMFVKGTKDVDYGKVAEVIDMGHQADVDNIGLITPRVEAGQ
jgi:biopolymer transport protein ExbD/biopolymer transport protein TolR